MKLESFDNLLEIKLHGNNSKSYKYTSEIMNFADKMNKTNLQVL